ncbi:MAG: isoprenylcysteine carboxylmethyltransferase family protein [Actinomycetia bacterium]|nr:isoprenylcysteine carboxylmethyltransferase family protein [Actinomycetes bacterium]
MGLFSGADRRQTSVAWAFVMAQFALIGALLLVPGSDHWSVPGAVDTGARLLQLVGVLFLVVGALNLGSSVTPLPLPVPHGELTTGGLYRLVRHPLYGGLMMLGVGSAVRSGNWWAVVVAMLLIGVLMAKSRWEEGHLRQRYPAYDAYARRTPRFVPFWPTGTGSAETGS